MIRTRWRRLTANQRVFILLCAVFLLTAMQQVLELGRAKGWWS